MRKILLLGAGKSATVLIAYLLKKAEKENWKLILADINEDAARQKIHDHPCGSAMQLDISNEHNRYEAIASADLVISLMPPDLHYLVAQDCLRAGRNLLTASYVDQRMRGLSKEAEAKGLLFLCEMGLDPGIDHMSAMKMIHELKIKGAVIDKFLSHCGGLVAPESDNNPWHYKISWNPRNVVNAGKAGAIYLDGGEIREMEYHQIFGERRFVVIPEYDVLCWYPNRDSLSYIPLYGLEGCTSFIRTTLRHPDFMYGWKNLVDLGLTDDKSTIETSGMSLAEFFQTHLERNGFSDWLEVRLKDHFDSTKDLLSELVQLSELEKKAAEKGIEGPEDFVVVNEEGDLQTVDIDELKINAAATLADKMHDASLTLKQLFYLGLDDQRTTISRASATPADILQLLLERKLGLKPGDKDLVVMLHEIEYSHNGQRYKDTASFVLPGEDDSHTAMAKTVGLPLGIAAGMILRGELDSIRGVQIPIIPEIYLPVLEALEQEGVKFLHMSSAV